MSTKLSSYFEAANNIQQGVVFLDRDGNILSVNKRYADALGYPKVQFVPKTIFQVSPHINFITWKKLWEELLVKGQLDIDTEHLMASGEALKTKFNVALLEADGKQYCQAIVEADLPIAEEHNYLARFCLDNASEMVLWANADGSIFYANQAAREALGYTSEELSSVSIYDLEPAYSKKKWESHWKEAKARQWLQRKTKRRKKSGKTFPVETTLQYMDINGRECIAFFERDINKREQWKKSIALSNEALESSIQMIYWLGPDGKFIYANQACCKKLGYTIGELRGMHLWEVEPGLTEASWKLRWSQLKTEEKLITETMRRSKQGKDIPVKLFLNYLAFEGGEYNVAIASDLSGLKETEEKLRLSYTTLDQSPDMIFWLKEDASFRYFNNAFRKKTGYSSKEISEMTILDFFPGHKMDDFKTSWEALKSGKVLSTEQEITCKDGSSILVATNNSMVTLGGREFSSTMLRDIRKWKRQELQLTQQLEEIKDLQQQLEEENIVLKAEVESIQKFDNIISQSPHYKPVLKQIGQVADTDATVLVLGESGTGKELVARAIYNLSGRNGQPFVKINCSALPENLIESELFGHEKGAFTGAYQRKTGSFEKAHRGTILLDEIGELPLDLQSKLLQVLQEGEFQRVGGTELVKVDVRVIAATNRDLEKLVEKGQFRLDLFYRLNVFPIYNIPLRERKDDIPLLVQHFIKKYNNKLGRRIEEVPPSAMKDLMDYEYPGNVRELENLIERAIILSSGNKLVSNFQFKKTNRGHSKTFRSMEDMQRRHIIEALRRTKGKVTGPGGAAELLKMKDKTLYSRMRKLGVSRNDF